MNAAAEWKPAASPLMTRWAKDVSPENVHPEYPRPQMVRDDKSWTSLNGLWDYAILPKDEGRPKEEADWQGQILVPFCVESALSGVGKQVGPENRLWYRRRVPRTELPEEGRLLLHFGACDWQTTVWINGIKVGEHQGGYDPFTFDVTEDFGTTKDISDEIVIAVWDPADASFQPRGKQVRRPGGIFYTSVTGIWQTVWLERVPDSYIRKVSMVPDVDHQRVRVNYELVNDRRQWSAEIIVHDDDGNTASVRARPGWEVNIPVRNPRLWSPDDPFLYTVEIVLTRPVPAPDPDNPSRKILRFVADGDRIASYVGMRKIEVKKDTDGFNRIFLNNKPLFQYGPLDQGWWPDGLYTAPTDAALKYDIEMTKKLGFNMARKHVKVEPARWYYWCDKLGLLVWQDMPSGDRSIGGNDPDFDRSKESEENFRREWHAIIDTNANHPSIVAWVPFNEGWGQFKTNEILAWTKKHDPTRLVDGPSGWTDRGEGDMHDMHNYPGPGMPKPEEKRAAVLGEFGGLGLPMEGHLWQGQKNWGYRTYKTQDQLEQNYELLMHRLRPLIGKGLAAAVYTQTTDVEGEVNGLMTYDREIVKLDANRVKKLHEKFYQPPPIFETTVLFPTSNQKPQTWNYTTTKPKTDDWMKPDFDHSVWQSGQGGFGTEGTPSAAIGTRWDTEDIWLAKTIRLKEVGENVHLRIHHDEDAEVYINGHQVASLDGYTTAYIDLPIANAAEILRVGQNSIAVHCRQTGGGQYIDVGLIRVTEKPRAASGER